MALRSWLGVGLLRPHLLRFVLFWIAAAIVIVVPFVLLETVAYALGAGSASSVLAVAGVGWVCVVSCGGAARVASRVGYRPRDIALLLIPVAGWFVLIKWAWRASSRTHYWATRDQSVASAVAAGDSPSGPNEPGASDVEATLRQLAEKAGGELVAYPRPGKIVRRVTLREWSDGESSQDEDAVLDDVGTLFVRGHDAGPRVSEFFGPSITSYEWIYSVRSERVSALISALGGTAGDDPLDLLADFYDKHGGIALGTLLRDPNVEAKLDNWHS